MTKDLTVKNLNEISTKTDDLIDKSNVFLQIFSRGADPDSSDLIDFKIFDDENKLALLAERMPEINRASNVFGRQNSQATGKLMSLHMIAQSPYRRLKQCLAKIERKRGALKENIFKLRREKIELEKMLIKRKELEDNVIEHTESGFDLELINIDIEEKICGISDSTIYIEGALKEIGMYQDAYAEICESYEIPEKWDEKDMEEKEIEEHVKTAFLHGIRDVMMTGQLNVGTHEYLEQYGVNPFTALKHISKYLGDNETFEDSNIEMLYDFLDLMYEKFKDEYKRAMKRLGLKTLLSEDFLYIENKED